MMAKFDGHDGLMMDKFEWAHGFANRFGMMWTNFTDPHRAVYRKKSADFFTHVATTNKVPHSKKFGPGTFEDENDTY